ncbi:MAG: cupin domain-containing protein, partial [Pseudomonadota bacterium]
DEVAKDPLRRADRRFIALVNEDTGEAGGALPSVFIGIQTFAPGEHIVPHRHNSYAVYHILQGTGYSILDGKKFRWKKGDTLVCPAMASHEHINDGEEQVIQYVFQDMPARAMERNLVWEEPIGRTFHMVEGNQPHQD